MGVAAASAPQLRAWKPPIAGIREVFHARFVDHVYPPHTHDTWTLFLVDEGAVRYDLHRQPRAAVPSLISILPPHVVHDGRPAVEGGYRKRVIYLETSLLGEDLIGPAVDHPMVPDPALRHRVARLHDALACADDLLEADTRLHFVVERIRAALGDPPPASETGRSDGDIAEELRALLDAHLFEPMTMAAAAARIGESPTRLARAFSRAFGIAPHAYVVARRLDAARDRILAGQPLADVAAEVGFCDQAHLTRRFRAFLGTTPGRFARSSSGSLSH
ncbi:MAG TPA: AraC family transcriptional regulator [candidate division Zixibacteria bacterium]|nr:AraC family transcriptional regulator [candidate division Zixibacteria bacterium]